MCNRVCCLPDSSRIHVFRPHVGPGCGVTASREVAEAVHSDPASQGAHAALRDPAVQPSARPAVTDLRGEGVAHVLGPVLVNQRRPPDLPTPPGGIRSYGRLSLEKRGVAVEEEYGVGAYLLEGLKAYNVEKVVGGLELPGLTPSRRCHIGEHFGRRSVCPHLPLGPISGGAAGVRSENMLALGLYSLRFWWWHWWARLTTWKV
jgi:hypothetical protein